MISVNSLTRVIPLLSALVSSSPKGRYHSELKGARQLLLAGLAVAAAVRLFSHLYTSKRQTILHPDRVSDNAPTVTSIQSGTALLTPPTTPPKVPSPIQGSPVSQERSSPENASGASSSSPFIFPATPPTTPPKASSPAQPMQIVADLPTEGNGHVSRVPFSPIRTIPEGQIPKTSLVKRLDGSLNQFEFGGKGDNACTMICLEFLRYVLGAELSFDGLAHMMNEILQSGIGKYQSALTANPTIMLQLGPNPMLSPSEINIRRTYPGITSARPVYASISEDSVGFFEKLLKDTSKTRSGALITCRDYTYAIAANPENGEFLFYDSHGVQKIKGAYVLCFSSPEKLAYYLAQRFPYDKTESHKNNLLFFPVRAA
jgi:hypothetical protein